MKTRGIRSLSKSVPYCCHEILLAEHADTPSVASLLQGAQAVLSSCYLPRHKLVLVCPTDTAIRDPDGIILESTVKLCCILHITGLGLREHNAEILSVCTAHDCFPEVIFLSDISADFVFAPRPAKRAFEAFCRELTFEC